MTEAESLNMSKISEEGGYARISLTKGPALGCDPTKRFGDASVDQYTES
jgi:hypothetical protein